MTTNVRRGGRGTLPDGAQLTWSLAEGGRGRRWRASRVRDGRLEGTILLEIDAAGRPARLELGTSDGLLTLHPDRGERELHGNVVTPDGIRHLRSRLEPGPRAGRRRLPDRAHGRRPPAGGRHRRPGRRPSAPRSSSTAACAASCRRSASCGSTSAAGARKGREVRSAWRSTRTARRPAWMMRRSGRSRPDTADGTRPIVDSRCGWVVDEIEQLGAISAKFVDKPVAIASGAPVS